jgi:hypothetical protein
MQNPHPELASIVKALDLLSSDSNLTIVRCIIICGFGKNCHLKHSYRRFPPILCLCLGALGSRTHLRDFVTSLRNEKVRNFVESPRKFVIPTRIWESLSVERNLDESSSLPCRALYTHLTHLIGALHLAGTDNAQNNHRVTRPAEIEAAIAVWTVGRSAAEVVRLIEGRECRCGGWSA